MISRLNNSNIGISADKLVQNAIDNGRADEAAVLLEQMQSTASDFEKILPSCIAVLINAGQNSLAVRALIHGHSIEKASSEYFIQLAKFAQALNRRDLEQMGLAKAMAGHVLSEKLQVRLVDLHLIHGDFNAATRVAQQASLQHPTSETCFLKWMECLEKSGKYFSAERHLLQRIQTHGVSEAIALLWGRTTIEQLDQPQKFIIEFSAFAGKLSHTWVADLLLGKACAAIGKSDEALIKLNQAVVSAPKQAKAWFELGVFQRRIGMSAESRLAFEQVLSLEPQNTNVLMLLGLEHQHSYGDAYFQKINMALAKVQKYPRSSQVEIHYAAAKALEDVAEYPAAFAHFARAGQLQKGLVPWSASGLLKVVKTLKKHATPQWYESVHHEGFMSEKPVFIIGMPRSGTSLVDQIIAAHPQASGAGELKIAEQVLNGIQVGGVTVETFRMNEQSKFSENNMLSLSERGKMYLDELELRGNKSALRITDKMPGNYTWAGLISAILPGSRFVHCRRHPIDTCLSQYRINFGAEVPYSYDLRDLGKAYRCYHELMQHWCTVIPRAKILHLRYEDLVNDSETNIRKLIAFLGLPWSETCLNFQDVTRQVRTASATQVRRPIYQTSVNNWKKYEKDIGPLIEELGNLITQYEQNEV